MPDKKDSAKKKAKRRVRQAESSLKTAGSVYAQVMKRHGIEKTRPN